ncbi:hypothetical protein Fcan01_18047 [Folsomia candida]|uniref:Uncharacterized protein n=1 Tax=Folsomia candida TaxID=158441 RepID=A0A226DRJ9_FOLCA|nr:hypothetical protein Fcan01_18047 [Folsomia candida]
MQPYNRNRIFPTSTPHSFGVLFVVNKSNVVYDVCIASGETRPQPSTLVCSRASTLSIRSFHQATAPQYWEYIRYDDRTVFPYVPPKFSNPFRRGKNSPSIHNYLAQQIFIKANATVLSPSMASLLQLHNAGSISNDRRLYLSTYEDILITSFTGYKFITCYSPKFLNFVFYLKPFQPTMWLGIIAGLAVVGATVSTHYTTEIFGLKPNTVEWLTFEKKLHNIPGDARKKMNRLTGLAGNSTIMSPEFSCSNSDDSETRVEEYLNLVGEN